MKKTQIFLLVLLIIGTTAQAQFRKPLQSSIRVNSSEAKYNIGLVGGVTMTRWEHFGGTKTQYNQPFNFGPVGGLFLERMINSSNSIGIEGLFAMRNTQLNYEVLNFPVAINQNKDYYRQYDVNYQEVDVQIPLSHYFSQGKLRPYVFVAPRVSIPLSGQLIWQKKEILNYGTEEQQYDETNMTIDTVSMNAHNAHQWNVGLVAGAGVQYKITLNNYYFLLKLDASYHWAAINSFTNEESQGESTNVIGAGYIDPYLLGKRFNTDAMVKLSFMFPLKKQLKGACMNWGEYD